MFTSDELQLLEARVVAACDAKDGVEDGTMNDPRQCAFDLGSLPLPAAKKAALQAVYTPTVNVDGEIYPGQPFGGEGQNAGWPTWVIGGTTFLKGQAVPSLGFAFGTGIFKYLVFNDPDWDYTKYDLGRFKNDSAQAAAYLNATDPNLDAFKARGGKLILWHGWADSGLTPLATIRYHEQVHARDANARAYLRTFMLPGVLHCNGGAGPDTVDWASVIADWVEHGRAPDRVVARKVVNGETVRTRPLCPYPLKAEYSGQGSTDDERNFVCR
jgi:feruloyl esterase